MLTWRQTTMAGGATIVSIDHALHVETDTEQLLHAPRQDVDRPHLDPLVAAP